MSYARWSLNDPKSDVYVYQSTTGFVIHLRTEVKSYHNLTAKQAADVLQKLKDEGVVIIPDGLIEEIIKEV